MTDQGHGWRFMELSGLVHAEPLHLVRVIFYSHDDTDVLQAYDGLTSAGRQVLYIAGEDAKGEAVEVGAILTNGLYVSLTDDCKVTVIFDPLDDE